MRIVPLSKSTSSQGEPKCLALAQTECQRKRLPGAVAPLGGGFEQSLDLGHRAAGSRVSAPASAHTATMAALGETDGP